MADQIVSTAWFSEQEKYAELFEKNDTKSFANQLKIKSNHCIIYQSDIINLDNGGSHEKTTNKKAIAYYFIAPVSCHVILFFVITFAGWLHS